MLWPSSDGKEVKQNENKQKANKSTGQSNVFNIEIIEVY